MSLNVGKMRRHMARTTPDAVWMTLDTQDPDHFTVFQAWRDNWARMMRLKYPNEVLIMNMFESVLLDRPGHVRVQFNVERSNNGARSR